MFKGNLRSAHLEILNPSFLKAQSGSAKMGNGRWGMVILVQNQRDAAPPTPVSILDVFFVFSKCDIQRLACVPHMVSILHPPPHLPPTHLVSVKISWSWVTRETGFFTLGLSLIKISLSTRQQVTTENWLL